jgi:alpha-glucosidase
MAFDFSLIFRSWNAAKYYRCIREWYRRIPENGWACNVLSNHDLLRSINRFPWRRHQLKKARVAAVLLLTLRGTPFLYYGEEIGIKNRSIPYRKILDPIGKRFWPLFSGRDKARTPMQWDTTPNAGFTTGIPWLPPGRDYRTVNVALQMKDPGSLLQVYRNIILARRNHSSLREGNWEVIRRGRRGLLVYARTLGNEQCVVMLNFTNRKKKCWLSREVTGTVIFSTEEHQGVLYLNSITAQPFEATVICVADDRKEPVQ